MPRTNKTNTPDKEAARAAVANGQLARLQKTVDDLASRINDSPSRSLRVRMLRSKLVPSHIKTAALDAVQAALDDARAALAAQTGVVRRVVLAEVQEPSDEPADE